MMEYLISALSLEKEVFEVSHAKSDWDILVVFFLKPFQPFQHWKQSQSQHA
jgi:hypothetical protein